MNGRMFTGERIQQLSREQKTGFVLLLFFAVLVVVLGAVQLRNTIYSPFVVRFDPTENDLSALFANEETKLQQLDTDRDGLNDYEELNFYSTSPYLPDTDSDGSSDKDELSVGSDPTCPQGQTCTATPDTLPPGSTTTPGSQFAAVPNGSEFLSGVGAGSTLSGDANADLSVLLSNPAQLRAMLLSTGKITPEQLSAISDEALLLQAKALVNVAAEAPPGAQNN